MLRKGVAEYTGKAYESAVGGVSLIALWVIEKSVERQAKGKPIGFLL